MERIHAILFLLVIFVWLSLLFGVWLIYHFIVPLTVANSRCYIVIFLNAVIKILLSIGIIAGWLTLWYKLTKRVFEWERRRWH